MMRTATEAKRVLHTDPGPVLLQEADNDHQGNRRKRHGIVRSEKGKGHDPEHRRAAEKAEQHHRFPAQFFPLAEHDCYRESKRTGLDDGEIDRKMRWISSGCVKVIRVFRSSGNSSTE
jgi:hypothetical protein